MRMTDTASMVRVVSFEDASYVLPENSQTRSGIDIDKFPAVWTSDAARVYPY